MKTVIIPDYKDYQNYIKTISYKLSMKSNIDIDDFVSLSGLVWTECLSTHNPKKAKFISYFLNIFHKKSLTLITKTYTQKNGGSMKKLSMDERVHRQKENNPVTLHDILSESKNALITMSDIALLSDTAKQILITLANYTQKSSKTVEKKKELTKLNTAIRKKAGVKYANAIKEICELTNGQPAKCLNTFPITGIIYK